MSSSSTLQQILDRMDTKRVTGLYWIITILAAIGGFLFGYDTAVIAIASQFAPYHYTGLALGYEVASTSLGAAIGSIIAFFYTDRFGRKSLLILDAGIYAIAAIAAALSFAGWWLLLWRTIIGVAIGADSSVATSYITEYAPKNRRGSLGIIQQWMITIGILGSYIVGSAVLYFAPDLAYTVDWRLVLGIAAIPAIIGLILRFLMPESPRWLLFTGQIERFRREVAKFGVEVTDQELQRAIQEIKAEEARAKVLDTPTKRALLFVGLWITFQQITGINVPFYYGPYVIQQLGLFSGASNPVYSEINAVLASTILAVINTTATVIAFLFIDRIGRRPLGISAYAGMFVFDLLGGILVAKGILIGALIAFAGFIIFFAYGVGGTGWLIQAEYFKTEVRGRMAAIISFIDWIANFALIVVFPAMSSAIGLAGSMFVFAVLDVAALLIVYFLMPETKGLSLEQTVRMFTEYPMSQWRKARELFLQKEAIQTK